MFVTNNWQHRSFQKIFSILIKLLICAITYGAYLVPKEKAQLHRSESSRTSFSARGIMMFNVCGNLKVPPEKAFAGPTMKSVRFTSDKL
jgi:hypothetical protein